ncbi:NAD(P)-dependent oxidoreductase [Candidatus Marinimicrobia bacterium]|nr:NAD(P)-dependent oxidoreductase [Candidatus Neomarinimicrobiota bacterium]
MEKIYIAGCGGMLGEAFYNIFNKEYDVKATDIDINENWLKYLDFRDYNKYNDQVKLFKPKWLFHLGAYTDLEFCELNQEDTYLTNTESVINAVKISNNLNIPLLYISTAGIFDGKKEYYNEFDKPNPIGHYAKSKYLGEKYVINNSKKYLICRAGWMMGGGPSKDKKFIQKIMFQIKNGSKLLSIVNDKLGTPTYTHDFANNVKKLIEQNEYGLFNMVCEGFTGRLEVAKELLNILNLKNKIKIKEVDSNFFSDKYFAERPYCERLINQNLNDKNLNIMRDWKIALKEYLRKYYDNYL